MGHTKSRTVIGILSFFLWIVFLELSKILKDPIIQDSFSLSQTTSILLAYLSIPIFFISLFFGFWISLSVILVTGFFWVVNFESSVFLGPLFLLILTAAIGRFLGLSSERGTKVTEVDTEKTDEELNVLEDIIRSEKNDNERIRTSLRKTARLQNIIEQFGSTVSEDEMLDAITRNTSLLFERSDRTLLYLVDTEKQELKLARSKKEKTLQVVQAKKGDVFDRWVLKHRMPLLVDDTRKDFRFSQDKIHSKEALSLISVPLTTEHKILGVLRVDSNKANTFSQADVRFLNIISDLSSVSLQNAILYKRVEDLAVHDSLTGLYVHKYFIERLKDEVKRALRNNTFLGLIMADLDHFKIYNDTHGHNAGDLALKHISKILASFTKSGDIASRYGGEEFVLLFRGRTKEEIIELAENMRKKVESSPLVLRREKTCITISIGLSFCPEEKKSAKELLMLADSRLLEAKRKGRNRVCTK